MEIFKTTGVCAKEIHFQIENNILRNIDFKGGCPGNLIGISSLVKDMPIDEAIEKLQGITCGPKNTSCPDQLSIALKQYKNSL